SIAARAIPELNEDARPEAIEPDWMVHFFERARLTSDAEMQSLWARILAGQANAPGAFSRRTIDAVGNLEKSDAALFTTLCRFAWMFGPDWSPLIYDIDDPVYTRAGINFERLSHLDDIGLITFEAAGLILF